MFHALRRSTQSIALGVFPLCCSTTCFRTTLLFARRPSRFVSSLPPLNSREVKPYIFIFIPYVLRSASETSQGFAGMWNAHRHTHIHIYIYIRIKKHQDNRFSVLRRRPPQDSHRVTPLHSVYSACFAPRHFFAHLFCLSVVDHRIFFLMLPICFETTLAGLHSLHALYSFQFWICFICVAFIGGESINVYMYSRCFKCCGGDLPLTQGNRNHTYSPLFHMCYALRRRTHQDSR